MPTSTGPEKRSLREQKKARTRAQILTSSATLFVAHGFEATTFDRIATHSGLSRPTIFNYFDNKAAILSGLIEQQDRAAVRYVEQAMATEREFWAQLRQFMAASAEYLEQHRALTELLLSSGMAAFLDGQTGSRRLEQLNRAMASMLSAARVRGEVDDTIDLQIQVTLLVGTYFYTLLNWVSGPQASLSNILQRTATYLAQALAPRSPQ